MTKKKPKIIAIAGPTASGKTSLAIFLAQKLGGEVVSVDSRQTYKGLDIGTGKVTKKEMRGIPHHLLDIANPKKTFTVSQYVLLAQKAINDILAHGKVPILCGGTGLYMDSVLGRVSIPEVPPHAPLRKQLSGKNALQLFNLLKKLDPRRARDIDRHNPVRLIRAIEIAKALGSVPSIQPQKSPYDVLEIGLAVPHMVLKKRINVRLSARIKQGMVREVEKLHRKGLSWKRMEALGLEYRYLSRYVRGLIPKQEMLQELEKEIVKYSKRQVTWFKRNKKIVWVAPSEKTKALRLAREFLTLRAMRESNPQ